MVEKPEALQAGQSEVLFEAPRVVSPNGLWPICSKRLKLVALLVFAKTTGWVCRKISPIEQGSAWDLPVRVVKKLKSGLVDPEVETKMDSRLCHTAPGKSLWAVGCSMLCFGLQMEEGHSTLEEDDSVGLRGFGFMVDKVLKSDVTKATDSETGVENCLWETKATKTDDAEVPVHMWNSRVSRRLTSLDEDRDLDRCCGVIREKLLL